MEHPSAANPPLPDLTYATYHTKSPYGAAMLVIAAGLFICLVKATEPVWTHEILPRTRLESFSGIAVLLCAWSVSVLWHEAGHLVAALALGFRLTGATLGPLRFTHEDDRWRLTLRPRMPFAASVAAIPVTRDRACWRRHLMLVLAAGPAATLIGVLIPLAILSGSHVPETIAHILAYAAEVNAVLFFAGLVPNSPAAPARNDAGLLLSLWFNAPDAHDVLLYHLVMQMKLQGIRPRAYPGELMNDIALARCRPEMRSLFAHTIAAWALDRGDEKSADAWDWRGLELAMASEPRHYQRALAHSLCFDVALRKDQISAQVKSSGLNLALLTPEWFRMRSSGISRLLKGETAEGAAELSQAESRFTSAMPYFDYERLLGSRIRCFFRLN